MIHGQIKKIALAAFCALVPFFASAQSNRYSDTDAVVLQDNCILWKVGEDGNLVDTKETLAVGTEIKIRATADFRTKTYSYTWVSGRNSQTGTFVRITYLDEDYYIFEGRIAIGMIPGIITVPSAAVYRTRNLADVKNSCLYSGRIIAVGKSYDIAGGIKMSEVAYFSAEQNKILTGYVRSDRVSGNRDDIKAIEMLTIANNTSDFSKKRQIISFVKDLNVTGNVLEMIGEAEMSVRRSSDLSLSGQVDVPTQVFYYAEKNDYINIRDMPSMSGNVLGTLYYDKDFTVIRRTARTQTLYGVNDFWYYGVSENKIDGWVFGGFLTPRPVEEEAEFDFTTATEGEGASNLDPSEVETITEQGL